MTDFYSETVYAYAAADGTTQGNRDFTIGSNAHPRAMAWDGTYFYVVFSYPSDDKVYVYSSSGVHQSSRDFDLATGNDHAFGIAWDGDYLYVTDGSDDKVYVYDADGMLQPDREFNLVTGNAHAQGIAWDGAYLYVVDWSDDKVYVYDRDGNHVG